MNIIKRNIPNTITCLNLAGGTAAIVFASRADIPEAGLFGYQWAMIFILFSALCDFLDGLSARLLKAYSELGKQLDSLSDLVSFGVAPAILVFNCAESSGVPMPLCWLALMIPVCGALRLARFNLDTSGSHNFRGLPIPSAALFCMGLVVYLMEGGLSSAITALAIVGVSLVMVSGIKMYSLKLSSLRPADAWPVYMLLAVALVSLLWLGIKGLVWIIIFYVVSSLILRNTKFTY